MTLSDLERWNARFQIFQTDCLYNARTCDLAQNRQDYNLQHVERGKFLGGQPHPYRKGAVPNAPRFLWFPSIYAHTL